MAAPPNKKPRTDPPWFDPNDPLPEYAGFQATAQTITITGVGGSYSVMVYVGLSGTNTLAAVNNGERYVYLGDKFKIYMRIGDLQKRVDDSDKTTLKDLYEADWKVDTSGDDRLFPFWDYNGASCMKTQNRATLPRDIIVQSSRRGDNRYDQQKRKWKEIIEAVVAYKGKTVTYNVYSRFLNPTYTNNSVFVIVLAPCFPNGETTVNILRRAKDALLSNASDLKARNLHVEVVAHGHGKDNGRVCVGHSPLSLYDTFMTPGDFQTMCAFEGKDPFVRNLPTQAKAVTADSSIANPPGNRTPRSLDVSTLTGLSSAKIEYAVGKRDNKNPLYNDQVKVMGKSATEFAREFWDKHTMLPIGSKTRPVDAEWLHRSGFAFGGLGSALTLNPYSSQVRENLVFGTSECNTDMIRAENAIQRFFANAKKLKRTPSGNLATSIITDQLVPHVDKFGQTYLESLNSYVDQERFFWLAPSLRYMFNYSDGTRKEAHQLTFDPFGRYRPTLFEARLDDYLLDILMGIQSLPSSPVPTPSTSRVVRSALPYSMHSDVHHIQEDLSTSLRSLYSMSPPLASLRPLSDPVAIPGVSDAAARGKTDRVPRHVTHAAPHHGPLYAGPAPAAPEGFVLSGNINLFGSSLVAGYYEYHGPIPLDVPHNSVYQLAILKAELKLPDIIPELRGTAFHGIALTDVMVTYQSASLDRTKLVGWTLEANLTIGKEAGALYDVLTTALGVTELDVHLSANLGGVGDQGWQRPVAMRSFVLEGTLPKVSVTPCEGVTLTQIGVRLLGIRTQRSLGEPSTLSFGFSVFGDIQLKVPHVLLPLQSSFEIAELWGSVRFAATLKGEIWTNAFGIEGLNLSILSFGCSLSPKKPLKSLSLDAEAIFVAGSTTVTLGGSYTAGGQLQLSATLDNLDWDNVNDIYHALHGDRVASSTIDIGATSATLTISSNPQIGLSLMLHGLYVEDIISDADAALELSSSGLRIKGELDAAVHFKDITLEKAFVDISLARASSTARSSVTLGGQIAVLDFVLQATVHLYRTIPRLPSSQAQRSTIAWVIHAEFSKAEGFALVELVPALKGSFLENLSLHGAALIAASVDNPELPDGLDVPEGAVSEGIQVCATLGQIAALSGLTRSSSVTDLLYLKAGWSTASGFLLEVMILAMGEISLGGTKLEPGRLSITTKPLPRLQLTAGIIVPIPKQLDPLTFRAQLAIDFLTASVTGEMHGYWRNPFGISEKLKIGPDLALKAEILLETGMPSGFGFSGALQFGRAAVQLECDIGEDAPGEMLHALVDSLDVADIVSFVNDIGDAGLPQLPQFADFRHVELYLCPFGARIRTMFYPAGTSFSADITLFGVRGNVSATVDTGGFKMEGGIDDFTLGPFAVRGSSGERALVDIEFTQSRQHVFVDGVIVLFDISSDLHLAFHALPQPDFTLHFALVFVEHLSFKVYGSLLGPRQFKDLGRLDFHLTADFEQELLRYISDEVTKQFEFARRRANQDLKTAEEDVKRERRKWQDGIDAASQDVQRAEAAWKAKEDSTKARSEETFRTYEARKTALGADIRRARDNFNKALADAQKGLREANNDRAIAMKTAQEALTTAQRYWGGQLRDAQSTVTRAEKEVSRVYQGIQDAISTAQRALDSVERELAGIENAIQRAEDASGWDLPTKASLPALYASRLFCQGAVAAARVALQGARLLVQGHEYIYVKGVAEAARRTLQRVKEASAFAIDGAKAAVKEADRRSKFAVEQAANLVAEVQRGPFMRAWTTAEAALLAYLDAERDVIAAAQAALDGLSKCAEQLKYKLALAALEVAKTATDGVLLAEAALMVARDSVHVLADVVEWMSRNLLALIDISRVRLSGSLHDLASHSGAIVFDALVDGAIAGQKFSMSSTLNIADPIGFMMGIFEKLWKDIKAGVIKIS